MSVERMRRVDEAVREVLSDVLTHEVKDPRVGFVTVTDVKTSPDLSHARVYVSVLGDAEAVQRLAGGPAVRARLPAGPRRRRAAPQAHADAELLPRRHGRAGAAPGAAHGRAGVSTVEADTREEVLDELRDATRFVLVTHENPDGDALGSLVAMHRILLALGKDSVMYMAADEFPLPYEYRFFELDGLQSTLPADLDERTIVFLDCGNIDRNPVGAFKREEAHILNIDHHHDNTRFGTVNHVVEDASCTAEIVWDLMRALGVEPAMEIAEALYVGLVTDTGKFMYENTGVRAHVMAAELIDAGVDVHGIYRRLYEGMPYAKLELLARALAHVQRYDDGRADLHPPDARRLPPLGRRGQLLGGHHRPPALGRGHEGRRARARAARGQPRGGARSRCAPPTAASTSRSSRAPAAGAATARRRASPPRCPKRTSSASCASRSPRSCSGRSRPRRQAPGEDLARPHARHAAAARACARPATPARWTRSRRDCCSSSSAARAACSAS